MNMEKLVVTLVGRDTVGIIAKVCTYFAENSINMSASESSCGVVTSTARLRPGIS